MSAVAMAAAMVWSSSPISWPTQAISAAFFCCSWLRAIGTHQRLEGGAEPTDHLARVRPFGVEPPKLLLEEGFGRGSRYSDATVRSSSLLGADLLLLERLHHAVQLPRVHVARPESALGDGAAGATQVVGVGHRHRLAP